MRKKRSGSRIREAGAAFILVLAVACSSGNQKTVNSLARTDPLGKQLGWVLDHLGGDALDSVTDNQLEAHFDASFLSQVPPAQLRQAFKQVASTGPYSFEKFEKPPTTSAGVAILAATSGVKYRANISIDATKPHRIKGLFFTTALDLSPPTAKSWEEFDRKLKSLAPDVGFLAAEIRDEELVTLHEINADRRLALGSTFKLYILGEIARQVREGLASWGEEIPIRDEWKSLPAGDMRNKQGGTKFTLQHYAEQMISVSDNTATDHLLYRAGRENVEKVQALMGHGRPQMNIPFLSTRESFILKLGDVKQTEEYIEADALQRREILARLAGQPLPALNDPAVTTWKEPRHIGEIEWFASPKEISNAMAFLRSMSERPQLVSPTRILSLNPGGLVDRKVWTFIGFKGGSEPGVLNMTWLLQRKDDRWFTLTVGLNDEARALDASQTLGLMLAAATLFQKIRASSYHSIALSATQ